MKHTCSFVAVLCLFTVLLACKKDKPKNGNFIDNLEVEEYSTTFKLSIDTFSEFPPEIDGCSCYFSFDQEGFDNKEYIFMSNFGDISFMKINGEMNKFSNTKRDNSDETKSILTAHNEKYQVVVELNEGTTSGDETTMHTGKISVTDENGLTAYIDSVGECGC